MRYLYFLIVVCTFFIRSAHALVLDDFIKKINTPAQEQIVSPATTEELRRLFINATQTQIPRIFVEKLPADFAVKGDKQLYAQVLAALLLRENEKAIQDQVAITLLKQKYDKKEPWTEIERGFFDRLVDKYDVVAKKTVPTQLEQLLLKADEVPIGLALAQSVYETDWGKKQMESPYGQMGWLNDEQYEKIPFDSLIRATESYVKEMNGTPNYFTWRIRRERSEYGGAQRNRSYNFALDLRVYRPEDPVYPMQIRKLILANPLLNQMDNARFVGE